MEKDDVQVYDPRMGKRVSLESALRRGIVDRATGDYIDKGTGKR